MREFTLVETGSLASLLVLSLVLPLMFGLSAPRETRARTRCLRTVWLGQMFLAVAGLAFYAPTGPGISGVAMGAASFLGCAFVLRRRLRESAVV